mgnify:CR=1 FL=1
MPVFLFGCLFSLVWSSAFVAGKVSIDYVLPLNFLFFRFVSAGLLLLAVWAWLNRRQPFAGLRNRRLWLVGSLLGLLNYALYLGFSYTGLQTVSPQLVILLVATTPFITLLLSVLLGTRLHAKLLLVAGLVGYHFWCRKLLADFAAGRNRRSHRWFRVFNEAPVLVLLAVILLVIVKPF